MNEQQRKQRAQGFIIMGLTTLAYMFYSVVIRDQPMAVFHYVLGAIALISLGVGVFFMLRDQSK